MTTQFYDKLRFLSLTVHEHCKKNHSSLVYYVLIQAKNGKSKKIAEFEKLSAENNDFEKHYDSIFKKYGYQLEQWTGGIAIVNANELLAFTKAYELKKEEIKKEHEQLRMLGASKETLALLDDELVEWAKFHSEFYEHIQKYQE